MGNPNGLNKAEATHRKLRWAQQGRGRRMGNDAGATRGKQKSANKGRGDTWETQMIMSFMYSFEDAVCASEM